ncbi:redoxin domain-containing protein [Saccharothrix sp.]|uniref:redoxin domain-containing protein n=1 Tax=Saccharothrix sp. TaxID=1873460 RepID=UPI002810BA66|nr:redoxin domain-containing protein [Saccharothrix sp.]
MISRSSSMRRTALPALVLLAVAGCGSPSAGGGASTAATTTATTTQTSAASPGATTSAPAATVPDQLRFNAKTVDGAAFSGESLAGKPAVLWFWAPWCPKCQREAPGMASAAKDNGQVTFLGVAALDKEPAMRDFVQRFGLGGFQHLADLDSAVWKRFGVTAQPAYAFISRDGKVEVETSQLSEQKLRERVAALAGA